jgi:hypothetical protein
VQGVGGGNSTTGSSVSGSSTPGSTTTGSSVGGCAQLNIAIAMVVITRIREKYFFVIIFFSPLQALF